MSAKKKGRIYCVVRPELGTDVYRSLVEYYRDEPDVEVIKERRKAERRSRPGERPGGDTPQKRTLRDRRRRLIPGTFPRI